MLSYQLLTPLTHILKKHAESKMPALKESEFLTLTDVTKS